MRGFLELIALAVIIGCLLIPAVILGNLLTDWIRATFTTRGQRAIMLVLLVLFLAGMVTGCNDTPTPSPTPTFSPVPTSTPVLTPTHTALPVPTLTIPCYVTTEEDECPPGLTSMPWVGVWIDQTQGISQTLWLCCDGWRELQIRCFYTDTAHLGTPDYTGKAMWYGDDYAQPEPGSKTPRKNVEMKAAVPWQLWDLLKGDHLLVCAMNGKCVTVTVTDSCRCWEADEPVEFALSVAAFEALGAKLDAETIQVKAWVKKKSKLWIEWDTDCLIERRQGYLLMRCLQGVAHFPEWAYGGECVTSWWPVKKPGEKVTEVSGPIEGERHPLFFRPLEPEIGSYQLRVEIRKGRRREAAHYIITVRK
ncbi:MAG: hypothetical protein AMJ93_15050 [Anaerolineae bacterium SM23_84]|nr:MAG: hypothetical protein AMJ93_15050 [Anaerolineae bacterium SM23_84]